MGIGLEEAYFNAAGKRNRRYASELGQRPDIAERISELLAVREEMARKSAEKAADEAGVDRAWILTKLKENAERALQAVPVLDEDGKVIGEFRYDGSVANRALELLGKERGMFIERRESGEPGAFDRMKDDELRKFVEERSALFGKSVARIGQAGSEEETSGLGRPN